MHEHPNCAQNSSPQQHSGYTLRPRQKAAIDMTIDSLRSGKKRPLIQAPCSFGKTIIAAEIFSRALAKGKRAMMVVPSISLIDQTYSKFFQAGMYDVGIIQANHPLTNPDAPIQIASVQTLRRRKMPKVDLVMPDEAHLMSRFYLQWTSDPDWQKIPFVALSATPWTKGLGQVYDDLIVGATIQQMMDERLACPMRIYNPEGPKPDLSRVEIVTNKETGEKDYHQGQVSELMSDPRLIGHVVQNWLEKGENRRSLAFCPDRKQARILQAKFEKEDVKTAYMDANTTRDERILIGQKLERREVQVVVQIATCVYGVDWPFLECIIWDRPTKSEMTLIQGLGRGMRLDPVNPVKDLVVFDHSLTTTDKEFGGLGHPLDIHHEFLCDGKPKPEACASKREKKETKEPSNTCPCGFVKRQNQPRCPECGFVMMPKIDMEHTPGELHEVEREGLPDAKANMDTKQRWYSQLLWMQDQRGYKDGWGARQYKEHFGVWPNQLSKVRTPAGQAVLNYIKARLIRWAKSKHNPDATVSSSRKAATLRPQPTQEMAAYHGTPLEFRSTESMADFFGDSLGSPSA